MALFVPFQWMFPVLYPLPLGATVDLVALPGAVEHPDWPTIACLALLVDVFAGRWDRYRAGIEEIVSIVGDLPSLIRRSRPALTLLATTAGDHATMDEIGRFPVATIRRPGLQWDDTFPSWWNTVRLERSPEAVDAILADLASSTNAFRRAVVLNVALLASLEVDPDRLDDLMLQAGAVSHRVVAFRNTLYHCRAAWHLDHNDPRAALDEAATASEAARRNGELSMLVPALVVHAVALQRLDRPREAALVRGALPRHWAIFHTRYREPLDDWLSHQLDTTTRERLAAEGRALGVDLALEIAPAVLHQTTASS